MSLASGARRWPPTLRHGDAHEKEKEAMSAATKSTGRRPRNFLRADTATALRPVGPAGDAGASRQRVKRGVTPSAIVWGRGSRQFAARLPGRAGEIPDAVGCRLRHDQSPLHPRPFAAQERGEPFFGCRIRRLPGHWGIPNHADRNNTLDDYINGSLHDIVNFVRRSTGSRQVDLLGYCMGGTMSAIYTALHPRPVKNLMLMAAGIDFATRENLINLWSDAAYFDGDAFVDAFGNCPASFLQSMFLMLKPVGNLIEKPLRLYERIDDEPFVDEYLTMETWLNDNIPLPGEVYRQFVKDFYQRNRLVRGELLIGGKPVKLAHPPVRC